ncbi:M20 metallopeptidase family protein [Pseudalkalibacillus caeni]|uniref:Amidohydrolase n=1 Tax=Exobacillus caeni TaxID=2574798 RepID=A0A5R9F1U8_9BACL|nr:M20 family metallopeptidase [Pseudalkalibacillus caeni]TLS37557.1 amidohydrolase [Pseudalkalibacillus caeni]
MAKTDLEFKDLTEQFLDEIIEARRHIHQHPELSYKEDDTAEFVISYLEKWDIPYERMIGTGVIVDIKGEKGDGLDIGVRADIDALPVNEQTDLPYESEHEGVMHACGHDAHTAILLGTVYLLNKRKKDMKGSVRCIFQPAEEVGAAKKMIEAGVLEHPHIDRIMALHLWPYVDLGKIGIKYDNITSSADNFSIKVKGEAGHSGRPHQAVDAIAIGAEIIKAFQFLVARWNNPVKPLVINVGQIDGGKAPNIISDEVNLHGTVRAVYKETRDAAEKRINKLVHTLAEEYGGKATIDYQRGYPAINNDEEWTKWVEKNASEVLGKDNVVKIKEPSMGADDFSAYSTNVPSTYFRLGVREDGKKTYDLHHPKFQFDDSVLETGMKVFTATVYNTLSKDE